MAIRTDQNRKKKTLPLQTHEAPSDEPFEGDVINGEIVDDHDPQPATEPTGPGAQKFTGKNPRTPGQRRADREDRRNQAWDERRDRENLPPLPKAETSRSTVDGRHPRIPMSQLRRDVDAAGKQYMEALRQADLMTAKRTPKERSSQLTGIHKGYVSMMVLSCLQPLNEGVNAKAILSMVGMGSAMWMLSPNFRNQVGDFGNQMKEAISTKIDERRQSQIDKVLGKAAEKGEDGKPLSQKWQTKLDRAERAARGGRDPYTAQSAGMTEVALTENAYAAMRMEGANVEEIRDIHDSMLKTLYEQAHTDGIDASEVAQSARVVVGLRLDAEPELAAVFGELSHGQFAKSPPREVRISGTGELAEVWTGEFESRLGQSVDAGSFGLRAPMDADQHQKAMADTMTADMISMTRQHGVDGLNMGVVGYASAWGLKEHPEFQNMVKMENPLGERLRTSSTMLSAMKGDSISPEEQQKIYSNAYVDAMETISALYPDVEQEWAAKFGENWRNNMRDFVRDPQNYMGQQGDKNAPFTDQSGAWGGARARESGPAHRAPEPTPVGAKATTRYRNARINQNYIETSETGLTGLGSDSSDFRDQDFEMGG